MSQALIPQEILDEIAAKCDIVSVIGEYVPLKRTGANYNGLCPFHSEKTPSFTVSPAKQIYYCFGCGEGGNIFKFMMKIENLTFPEAVAKLAAKAGVSLPKKELSKSEKERLARLQRLYKINDLAARYYQKVLLESKAGKDYLDYLLKRGMNKEIIEKFSLGATPAGWDGLVKFLAAKGIKEQEMLDLGLASKSKDGQRIFDRFRERVMFPIRDERGRVIAFGGRLNSPEAKAQKYMNSPDTPLFHKSKVLYGLDLAKNAIRAQDSAILVEGYMDVIACHQYGISNVVAPLGTAFTAEQAKLIMRHSYQVYVSFDGDAAGEKAAMRSLDIFSSLGLNVHVLTLPGGRDPDEYLREFGQDAFLKELKDSPEYLMYKTTRLLEKININDINGKSKVVQALLEDLRKIKSPVALESAVSMIARKLQVGEQTIMQELRQNINAQRHGDESRQDSGTKSQSVKIKQYAAHDAQYIAAAAVLGGLYKDKAKLETVQALGGGEVFAEPLKELYQKIVRGNLGEDLSDEESSLLAQVLLLAEQELDNQKDEQAVFDFSLTKLALEKNAKDYQKLLLKLNQAEKAKSQEDILQILQQLEQIRKEKEKLENKARGMK